MTRHVTAELLAGTRATTPALPYPRRGASLNTSFRFVHAADLHIDSPFKGLRDVDERVASRLQSATFEAFQNLVDLCIDEQAAFLLIAGDVYDSEDRGVRAQVRFRDGLAKLAERGIETFVVHGNHDALDGWQSAMAWPRGVHIFGAEPEWQVAHLASPGAGEAAGVPVAVVQGVSYPSREVSENLVKRFRPPERQDLFTIGLLHCNVGANPDHPNYAPCSVEDLAAAGVDYWALGHVHTRQTLRDTRRSGPPTIAYPGNTQGRHPNEPGARGCLIVDVSPDRVPRTEFRALDVVRWHSVEVNIAQVKTLDALMGALRQSTDDLIARAEGRDVVCRITLRGRGPMHAELRREGALEEVLALARADAASASPWVWVERLSDETRPDMDLPLRARQDDFLGAVLRHGAWVSSDPAGTARLSGILSDVFNGRRNGLQTPSKDDLGLWTEEARWRLAELLEPEK